MKKQISIVISPYDLIVLLKEKGIEVPDTATFNVGGDRGDVVLTWDDFITTTPSDKLHAQLAELCKAKRRIEAIKVLRAATGWMLRESKDYIDKHFPS